MGGEAVARVFQDRCAVTDVRTLYVRDQYGVDFTRFKTAAR